MTAAELVMALGLDLQRREQAAREALANPPGDTPPELGLSPARAVAAVALYLQGDELDGVDRDYLQSLGVSL